MLRMSLKRQGLQLCIWIFGRHASIPDHAPYPHTSQDAADVDASDAAAAAAVAAVVFLNCGADGSDVPKHVRASSVRNR